MTESVADELRRIAKGEVYDDEWSREIYSVDASYSSLLPLAVVNPIDKYDIQKICQYSFTNNLPITARGAGTRTYPQTSFFNAKKSTDPDQSRRMKVQ